MGTDDLQPPNREPLRVDLGCGRAKLPGFVGVDRFPLPEVDLVADMNDPLPFDDDSVDLVHASHSLEHIADLSSVIREVSRICRHGAQVCIVAPYYQQGLNLANPYHKHVFNEHTPRFWTAHPSAPIEPADYVHPHAPMWGLLQSDNSEADIDLRCVKMEFFHFPEYRDLPPHVQRYHRQHESDVCDQIVYHLIVLKKPTPDDEFLAMTESAELFDSPYVALRRMKDRCDRLEADHREAILYKDHLEGDLKEVSRYYAEVRGEFAALNSDRQSLSDRLDASARENADLRRAVLDLQRLCAERDRLLADVTGGTSWRAIHAARRACAAIARPMGLRGRRSRRVTADR